MEIRSLLDLPSSAFQPYSRSPPMQYHPNRNAPMFLNGSPTSVVQQNPYAQPYPYYQQPYATEVLFYFLGGY